MVNWSRYTGMAGVAEDESQVARIIGSYFGYVVIIAVVWMAIQWQMQLTGKITQDQSNISDFLIWLIFVTETCVCTYLVKDKIRYLKQNWLNLFIIASGSILLFAEYEPMVSVLRSFRIFIALGLLIPWLGMLKDYLTDSRLETTIFAVVVILILSGVTISVIDPAIDNIPDGIWWAWVTITTVGYGDVVPVSTAGRLFSGLLILAGLGIFSVFTANFAALLVQKKVEAVRLSQELENEKLDEIKNELKTLDADDDEILALLRNIDKRLDVLEKNQKNNVVTHRRA